MHCLFWYDTHIFGYYDTSFNSLLMNNMVISPISYIYNFFFFLTHWCRVTHICISDLTSIGSDNGLSPGRRQAIIRTNAGILLIRPLGTNFSEFLVEILIVSFKKMCLKVSSAKRRPFCLGLNELNTEMTQGTRACLSYTDNTMATDDPDAQEPWESAAMISTCYPGIIRC